MDAQLITLFACCYVVMQVRGNAWYYLKRWSHGAVFFWIGFVTATLTGREVLVHMVGGWFIFQLTYPINGHFDRDPGRPIINADLVRNHYRWGMGWLALVALLDGWNVLWHGALWLVTELYHRPHLGRLKRFWWGQVGLEAAGCILVILVNGGTIRDALVWGSLFGIVSGVKDLDDLDDDRAAGVETLSQRAPNLFRCLHVSGLSVLTVFICFLFQVPLLWACMAWLGMIVFADWCTVERRLVVGQGLCLVLVWGLHG